MPATLDTRINPLLRLFYDFVFAFDRGASQDTERTANYATAPTVRTLFRMCCTYNGAIFWKMRAGMGDTIFTPLYKALAQRGVQFRFFTRCRTCACRMTAARSSASAWCARSTPPAPTSPW